MYIQNMRHMLLTILFLSSLLIFLPIEVAFHFFLFHLHFIMMETLKFQDYSLCWLWRFLCLLLFSLGRKGSNILAAFFEDQADDFWLRLIMNLLYLLRNIILGNLVLSFGRFLRLKFVLRTSSDVQLKRCLPNRRGSIINERIF